MDFSAIGRRLSQDALWDGETADERAAALRASLSESSSRLISSVRATKNDIFGGLSSRIDQMQNALKNVGVSDANDVNAADDARDDRAEKPTTTTTTTDLPRRESRPKPQKPPPPKLTRRTTVNGGVGEREKDAGDNETTNGTRVKVRPNMAISFDEPLYSRQETLLSAEAEMDNNNEMPQRKPFRNPFLDDYMSDVKPEEESKECLLSTNTVGSNLLPGIPSVQSSNTTSLLAPARPADLLAITPTSGEALPLPGIEPTVPSAKFDSQDIYDDSDGDSEATEGCDDTPDRDPYGTDAECSGPLFRSGSVGSDKSWSSTFSNDSQPDEVTEQCMEFMKDFVGRIFGNGCSITQADKARFGELCQYFPGRLWFARYINAQRVNNKLVTEEIIYQLVQFFAVALFECNEAEDFGPAKTLMNMCFTFYHEVPRGPGQTSARHFLYNYLRDQPVWHSLRFWNAAFFDALQLERARRPVFANGDGTDQLMDDKHFQENITFGQLGTFTCNMRAFGLSKDLCLEFLRKQCTIANLRGDKVKVLRDNVEKWIEQH